VLVVGHGVEFLAFGQAGLQGGADEVGIRDARDFRWVLEGEEEPGAGAFVDIHIQQIDAVHDRRAFCDRVVFVAGEGLGEGGFARSVRAHDCVDFAAGDAEAHSFEDGGAVFEFDVQVFNVQGHGILRCLVWLSVGCRIFSFLGNVRMVGAVRRAG